MAEERLIDDDKDRKYKIRKNADGEEELIVIDPEDGEEEGSDIPVFNVPVYDEDDEEAATLTPEQLAERERKKQEEEKQRERKVNSLIAKTYEKLEEGDFEGALYNISQAELLADKSGEVYFLKLKALSRNLTDFISSEDCAKAADGVAEYCNKEQKAQLKQLSAALESRIAEAEKKCGMLYEENENKKEERRSFFAEKQRRATGLFLGTAAPAVVLLIVAIVCGSLMFSVENGTFIILTIVFAALTLIAFIITLFTAKKFLQALRNVRLNEKDTSTKLGRDYVQSKTELEQLKRVKASFENDLS